MKIHATPGGEQFECHQEDAVTTLNRKIEKLDKTIFFGNGTPALTTQMATLTQAVGALTRLGWITLAAVIGQLVYIVFDKVAK